MCRLGQNCPSTKGNYKAGASRECEAVEGEMEKPGEILRDVCVCSDVKGCKEKQMKATMCASASQHKKVLVPLHSQCECGEQEAPGPCHSKYRGEAG